MEELKVFHMKLEAELAVARTQEQESRRQITVASDELDALRKKHAAEITDLELLKSKADRECRQLKEDVRILEDDLRRERETSSALKV